MNVIDSLKKDFSKNQLCNIVVSEIRKARKEHDGRVLNKLLYLDPKKFYRSVQDLMGKVCVVTQ